MTGWLLDTNVIAEIRSGRPNPSVREWLEKQSEHTIFLSILTLAEYQKGIHNLPEKGAKRSELEKALTLLEARFAGRILPLSDDIVLTWGSMSGAVKRKTGHPPPVIDSMFAATALRHNLYFVTRNVKDVAATGVKAFNPWTDDPNDFLLRQTRP